CRHVTSHRTQRMSAPGRPKGEYRSAQRTGISSTAFAYRDGELHAEGVPLSTIAARFGTPCYVYSRAALENAYREFDAAFADVSHLVCYALKANSNLAILNLFVRLGS